MASLITLLTDFGTADTYVGQMKGVIARIAPEAVVVDLSHEVPAQDVAAAGVMLADAVNAFPDGTIHLAVVDPGVGMERAALAVDLGRCKFVGPDNGLITPLLDRVPARYATALDPARLRMKQHSHTFHGRDIFAPAAAYLAKGDRPTDLGESTTTIATIDLPTPDIQDDRITAHVLLIDRFGNLITDLRQNQLDAWAGDDAPVTITVGKTVIKGVRRTFGDVEPDQPVAYIGSGSRLEIAVRNGHAARTLAVQRGDAATLTR